MIKTAEASRCLFAVAVLFAGLTGCNKAPDAPAQAEAPNSNVVADADPASGNLAPADQSVAATQTTSAETSALDVAANYPPDAENSSYDLPVSDQNYSPDSGYDTSSDAQQIEAADPPPPLPEYTQPECPGDGYYWTPGYWAYGQGGYYWIPGAWVMAPWVDALWTPPYWDYESGYYRWHSGYWGPHIGFYGGIDYGFGYTGRGYYGAYWNHGSLNYNRSVTNVNTAAVHNVYNYAVPSHGNNRVSYNGGRGGIDARPTPQERAVVHDPRTPPVAAQAQHAREASTNRAQFASAGHEHPSSLVAAHPLTTSYRAPAVKPPAAAMRNATEVHGRPNQLAAPENKPGERQAPGAAAGRPAPGPRAPEIRQSQTPQEARPVPQQRPAPEVRAPEQRQPAANRSSSPRPGPVAAPRPLPETRQAAPAHPAQEARPAQHPAEEARPAERPAPEARPAAQRSAPEARPAERPAAEAQPAQRSAPEARPVPQRAAPEARPAPQPEHRAAPEARPAPPAAARRPVEAHPAPPPARPKPEEKKDK